MRQRLGRRRFAPCSTIRPRRPTRSLTHAPAVTNAVNESDRADHHLASGVALARVRPRHRRQHGASSRHAILRFGRTVESTAASEASRRPDSGDDATAPVPARNFRQDVPRFRRRRSPAPASDPDPRAIARAHPAVQVPARFRRRFRGRCRRVRRSRRRHLAVSGCARSATLDLTVVTAPLLRQVPGHLRSAPDASVPAGVVTTARFRERNRPERRRVRRGS